MRKGLTVHTADDTTLSAMTASADTHTLLAAMDRHALIVITDHSGILIHANDNFCERCQYPRASLIGQNYRFLSSGQHTDAFWDGIKHSLKTHKSWKGEISHKARDGSIFWLDTYIAEQSGKTESSIRYIAIQHDITQAKLAEQSYVCTEHILREASRIAHIGSWEFLPATQQMIWSEMTKAIHEVPDDYQPTIENAINFYEPTNSRKRIKKAIKKAIESGQPCEDEFEIITYKGNRKWVKGIIHTEMHNGECQRLYGIFHDIHLSRLQEIKNTETNNFLNNLLDAATDFSIISTDISGRIIIFNYGAEKMLGYSRKEVVGKRTPEFIHIKEEINERAKELSQKYGQTISGFDVFTYLPGIRGIESREWTYLSKDGRQLPVALTVTPMHDKAGKLSGYLGIARDLSLRKKAEKSLLESERRFREAFTGSPTGICLTALNGQFMEVNPAMCRIIGYSESQLLKMTFQSITHPDDLELNLNYLKETIDEKRKTYQMTKRYIHAKGHIIWARLSVSCIRDDDGTPLHLISQIDDITERRALEEEVSKISERLSIATIASEIGVWDWDIKTNRLIWDNQTRALYDIPGEEPTPDFENFVQHIHPEDLERLQREVQRAFEFDTILDIEFRIVRPNGQIRYVWAIGKLQKDSDGKPLRMIGTNRNVTQNFKQREELARLAEEANSANRAKSDFLANMSHEIRTPLNGIIGMATILGEQSSLNQEQKECISIIQSSSQLLLSQISDILDFAKIEAGKLDIEQTEFNLRELLEECASLPKQRAAEKGIYFSCQVADDCPQQLVGDPHRIRQVIINLTSNAIKFTEKGSVRVYVEVSEQNNHSALIRFTVLDTGIGISPQNQKKLFQQFTQADSSISRQYGGSGLGLAISKQLVQLMHGEIGIESKEGSGSIFWFSLRLPFIHSDNIKSKAKTPEKTAAFEQQSDMIDGSQYRILLVEDNRANQMVINGILKRYRFKIDIANNGLEAIEYAAKHHYDLIFMDIQMPKMDGMEATRRIRNRPEQSINKSTPIIAVTAHARREDRENCLSCGMNDYITKPVNRSTLIHIIREQLKFESMPNQSTPTIPINELGPSIEAPIFSLKPLLDLTANDQKLCREILESVITDIQTIRPKADLALGNNDAKALRNVFHTAKGLALNTHCQQLAIICEQMEGFAFHSEFDKVRNGLIAMDRIVTRTIEVVSKTLEKF